MAEEGKGMMDAAAGITEERVREMIAEAVGKEMAVVAKWRKDDELNDATFREYVSGLEERIDKAETKKLAIRKIEGNRGADFAELEERVRNLEMGSASLRMVAELEEAIATMKARVVGNQQDLRRDVDALGEAVQAMRDRPEYAVDVRKLRRDVDALSEAVQTLRDLSLRLVGVIESLVGRSA